MSEKVKLIIEISEHQYEICKQSLKPDRSRPITECEFAIAVGTPLDNDSERAETQAYFAGEAYGWEQGRKALIEDVKAEIETDLSWDMFDEFGNETSLHKVLMEILDNITNAESKDPNDLTHMFDGVTEIPKGAFKGWTTEELLEQIKAESEDT